MPKYEVEYRSRCVSYDGNGDVYRKGDWFIDYETIDTYEQMSRQSLRSYIIRENGLYGQDVEILNVDVSSGRYEKELEQERKYYQEQEEREERRRQMEMIERFEERKSNIYYSNQKSNIVITPTPTPIYSPPTQRKPIPKTSANSSEDTYGLIIGGFYFIGVIITAFFWIPEEGWFFGLLKSFFCLIVLLWNVFF